MSRIVFKVFDCLDKGNFLLRNSFIIGPIYDGRLSYGLRTKMYNLSQNIKEEIKKKREEE